MLAVASLVGGVGDDDVAVTAATVAGEPAEGGTVRAASLGSPSEVRALLSETTTTLVEATGASTTTTSTTAAPSTEPGSTTSTTTTGADGSRALRTGSTTTSAAPTTTPARQTTTTTTRPAPTTTAPPTTAAPTTSAPPPPEDEATSEGYADDDPRGTQVWYDLARCESGGNWSIDTGNGYYGGLQFSLATWESVGGTGYPHEHTAATQIEFGRELQARQGWGAWPHCSEELGLR